MGAARCRRARRGKHAVPRSGDVPRPRDRRPRDLPPVRPRTRPVLRVHRSRTGPAAATARAAGSLALGPHLLSVGDRRTGRAPHPGRTDRCRWSGNPGGPPQGLQAVGHGRRRARSSAPTSLPQPARVVGHEQRFAGCVARAGRPVCSRRPPAARVRRRGRGSGTGRDAVCDGARACSYHGRAGRRGGVGSAAGADRSRTRPSGFRERRRRAVCSGIPASGWRP